MDLSSFMASLMNAAQLEQEGEEKEETRTCCLDRLTLEGVADAIKTGKVSKIIVMCGAGISVAAGIPDFRSPGTGLYDNLQKYNLPEPEAVFEIGFFKENPKPFCMLAKELYPGEFNPTIAHYFIRLLHEKGVLKRCFSQNIDTLERVAGLPGDFVIEAHGSFATATCLECRTAHTQEYVKEIIFRDEVPHCSVDGCDGLVKPDIVFFGESLPQRYWKHSQEDFPDCDLLIVMGTSLAVQPFAGLIHRVPDTTPRLLLNWEEVGVGGDLLSMLMGGGGEGFKFGLYRDVKALGDVQRSCAEFIVLLGWREEFERMSGISLAEILEQPFGRPEETDTLEHKDAGESVTWTTVTEAITDVETVAVTTEAEVPCTEGCAELSDAVTSAAAEVLEDGGSDGVVPQ